MSQISVKPFSYVKRIGRGPRLVLVAALLFVGVVVFAINVSNYGTAIRHRAKFAPYVVAMAVMATAASQDLRSRAPGYDRAQVGDG